MSAEKRAALLKELLDEKSKLQVRADKQLDVALRSLEKLNSSPLGYSKFLTQLSRLGVLLRMGQGDLRLHRESSHHNRN